MNNFLGFMASISSGVIVSLVTLWLAGRQRTKQDRLAEQQRRETILAGIGRELQWNRTAIKDLELSSAHYLTGDLKTVAFERYGAELATIASESLEPVFEHYAAVSRLREGVRILAIHTTREINERALMPLIGLLTSAGPAVGNSATAALKSLGIALEPQASGD